MKHQKKINFNRHSLSTPTDLLAALTAIFPDLLGFPDAELIAEIGLREASHHTVLMNFRSAFDEDRSDISQLATLAELIQISLGERDNLENAWMTVFMERRPQSGLLWSHLSSEAKRYIKAN